MLILGKGNFRRNKKNICHSTAQEEALKPSRDFNNMDRKVFTMILCWVDIDPGPAEFKIIRTWENVQDSESYFDLTSRPILILVEPKASLYGNF